MKTEQTQFLISNFGPTINVNPLYPFIEISNNSVIGLPNGPTGEFGGRVSSLPPYPFSNIGFSVSNSVCACGYSTIPDHSTTEYSGIFDAALLFLENNKLVALYGLQNI